MRRGLQEDLPESLASGEIGWSIDQRRLFIGNGTYDEGAPELGNTEILTSRSDVLSLDNVYSFKGLLGGYQVQTGDTPSLDVTRTMQDKFDDMANIRDFGTVAMGNGVFNCAHVFNHAIEQLYKASKVGSVPAVRRTLHVPAGTYMISGDFIRLLPYVKLKGDGKNSTFIIQVDASQPCVVASAGIKPSAASNRPALPAIVISPGVDVPPGNIEVEGITFINMTDNDVVVLDSTVDVLFNRVGMLGDTAALIPGSFKSAVKIDCSKTQDVVSVQVFLQSPSKLAFIECDFAHKAYGIYSKMYSSGVHVIGSTFTRLYRGVALGLTAVDYPTPSDVKISHSVFDRISLEGIVCGGANGLTVNHIVSAFNTFGNVGYNQSNTNPASSAIYFNGDNCYSFGDTFTKAYSSTIPSINLNSKSSFATLPNGRMMMGTQLSVGGSDTVLEDGMLTHTSSNIIVGFDDYPTIVEYTILRNTDKRVGTLHISPISGTVAYSDDYVETGDVGVSLAPTINNNAVELFYTTTIERYKTILKLSSRTLTGITAPARMPNTVPDAPIGVQVVTEPGAPTNVVASLVITVPDTPTDVQAVTEPGAPTNVIALV